MPLFHSEGHTRIKDTEFTEKASRVGGEGGWKKDSIYAQHHACRRRLDEGKCI